MRIAVTYNNGEIFEHFGHCETFAVYDYANGDVNQCTKVLLPCADRHGHEAMALLMKEQKVDVVICGNMGAEAKNMLLSMGIIPLAGYCGSTDDAADMLIMGRLPIMEGGSCGGGCGGCGGECHHDEETGECGCGCGGCGQ